MGPLPKSEKGNNSVICSKNFMKSELGHYPSSNGCLSILSTRLLYYTECQNRKRDIIPPIYRILPKVNQVIYTSDTICRPNIMILAQGVLQIFCSQGHLWVKRLSLKREIIQSYIH